MFLALQVRNLDIGKADTAYTIIGLQVQGGATGPVPITGIVLENITVREPGMLGKCSWAEVSATDLKPALPPCENKLPPAPASCAVGKVLGCYDDSKIKGLGFAAQPAVHDKTTLEVCAGACHTAGTGKNGKGQGQDGELAVAAIDAGNHCFCSTTAALAKLAASLKRPAAECEASSCHANASETGCGGKGRMVAYTFKGCTPAAVVV